MPKLVRRKIERKYNQGLRSIVKAKYKETGRLEDVAEALGTTRMSLYRWIGRKELAMLKAQGDLERDSETQEINAGVL